MHNNRIRISKQQLHQIQARTSIYLRAAMDGDNKLFAIREVINSIIYLIFLKSNSGQYSSHYCTPSMKYLGSKVFRSDETAHRIISQLVNLHLIHKLIRRKSKSGNWLPNAYYPGSVLGRIIDRLLNPRPRHTSPSVKNDRQLILNQINTRTASSEGERFSWRELGKNIFRGGGQINEPNS
ncbi:hypothetical protein LCGC14_0959540 [marine sediment metagenome]|uniref:Uncharacterized protein n=1 Tax=marine sediment metagenome TaxID=412755 RepID=A0A0F9NES3_9ZZZZ